MLRNAKDIQPFRSISTLELSLLLRHVIHISNIAYPFIIQVHKVPSHHGFYDNITDFGSLLLFMTL